MWAIIAIAIVALLLLLCCCFCICKRCCKRKKKDKDKKKGLKGAVDLGSVKILGNSYKEKVCVCRSFAFPALFAFLCTFRRSLYPFHWNALYSQISLICWTVFSKWPDNVPLLVVRFDCTLRHCCVNLPIVQIASCLTLRHASTSKLASISGHIWNCSICLVILYHFHVN